VDTAAAAWEAAQDVYYASHSWNPFFFHGTNTFAFEVCEGLGWKAPGSVVIPTGNGTLLIGAWIGFRELFAAGVIDRLPRLLAVQAEACAPLARAAPAGGSAAGAAESSPTIAEGIAIAAPVRRAQCLEAVNSTGGGVVTVSEGEIKAALRAAVRGGLFIEPTSASALAAAARMDAGGADGPVVVAITGHGLKAPGKIADVLDG
jgi:threonine synthase